MKNKVHSLLRWSEKYTKTDMVYLASNGFWLTLGQIVASLTAFCLSIVFANFLPKETYGTYKYVLSILGIFSIATLPGIWTAINQSVANGFHKSLLSGTKTRIYFGFIGSVVAMLLSGYYLYKENYLLGITFLIITFFVPFFDSLNSYDAYLYGVKDFRRSAIYFISAQTISTITLLIVLFLSDNLFLVLLAYLLPWTILRLVFFFKTTKSIPEGSKAEEGTKAYGKHLSLMSILNIVAMNIDKILIFHYLGALELAIYSFAIAMPDQIKALFNNVSTVAFPKFVSKEKSEILKGLKGKFVMFGILIFAISLLYIIICPLVFSLLFPQYQGSVLFSQIYSLSLLGVLVSIPTSIMQAKKETKNLYAFNIIQSLVQIVSLFFFIYFFGLWGAILARVVTRLANLAISIKFISN